MKSIILFFQTVGRPLYYGVVYLFAALYALYLALPKRKLPSIRVPQVELPRFEVPTLPKVALPTVTLPTVSTTRRQKRSFFASLLRFGEIVVDFIHFFFESIFSPITISWKVLSFPFRIFPNHTVVRFAVRSLVVITIISAAGGAFYYSIFMDLPDPHELQTRRQPLTTKIYDRRGRELYRIYVSENRTPIKLSELPPHVIQATLAIEDAGFYTHPGFSIKGIFRAFTSNLSDEKVQGGSTITQQLVKNTLLSSEKRLRRKIRELFLAIAVESIYEKDQILEMYFNQIPYGGTTYGIEEASYRYFGKHARDLTVAEAALLAGIPAAPTAYSPFGPSPDLALVRQQEVLRRMVEVNYITSEEATAAMSEELKFMADVTPIKAPHFVMYVRSLLAEKYGEDVVAQGGLEVFTTLDLDVQNEAQQIVTDEINQINRYHITNGAALMTEPATGEVLAMVGSKDYFNVADDGQVNLTTSQRQPGSSIKPITYAMALERGYTPSSTIEDQPVRFKILGSKDYTPQNYDGKFHGNVSLRQALANSYNIPAVKLLAALGVNALIDKAELMGIETWTNRSRFGLALTLGGGEVEMTDMAEVYGVFANSGYRVDLNPLLLVKDSNGNVLYENNCVKDRSTCTRTRALDPRVAYQISSILSDNGARSAAFGSNSVLNIPGQQVAVKTGTTNDRKDNWTIGYTADRLAAVWVGNNDGSPMSYVASGITGASPIWNKIIRTQLDAKNPHVFAPPADLKKVAVCVTTGTLSCAGCPQVREEYFVPGTEPTSTCNPSQFQADAKPKNEDKPREEQRVQN